MLLARASDVLVSLEVAKFDMGLMTDAFRMRQISRDAFGGWVSTNRNRAWEYPWVLNQVRRRRTGLTKVAVDFGAGRSPVPIGLSRLGFVTTVVDPDSEAVLGRRHGNEWDFIDYTTWGIETHKASMEEPIFDEDSLGVAASVSVIEHLTAEVRRNAIRELARVVEPGGLVVLTVDVLPGGSRHLWNRVVDQIESLEVHGTADDVIQEAAACGLSLIRSERCPIADAETSVVGLILTKA